jgi:hypothetical protein
MMFLGSWIFRVTVGEEAPGRGEAPRRGGVQGRSLWYVVFRNGSCSQHCAGIDRAVIIVESLFRRPSADEGKTRAAKDLVIIGVGIDGSLHPRLRRNEDDAR